MKPKILLIDDDKEYIELLSHYLEEYFYCITAASVEKGLKKLSENPLLIVLDLEFESKTDGISAIPRFREIDPDIPIIISTQHDEYQLVVHAIQKGANDYFVKSPDNEVLKDIIDKTLNAQSLKNEVKYLKNEISALKGRLIGSSKEMEDLHVKIKQAAGLECPVLITGETGTGKELTARAVHEKSKRNKNPFIAVNVSTINNDLFSSELFGYEKGAFTGAVQRKKGLFEAAGDGTLLLDEIGDLPMESQVKLLRAIEEKEIRRVGGIQDIPVNCRIIASTNKNMQEQLQSGNFREDLYYRLNVFNIEIPPLCRRKDDIFELTIYFLKSFGKNEEFFSNDAYDLLNDYNWPGNVRQLKNIIEIAASYTGNSQISSGYIKPFLTGKNENSPPFIEPFFLEQDYKTSKEMLNKEFRQKYLDSLLKRTGGNVTEAAKLSGLNRVTLHKMLQDDNSTR